MKCCGDNRSSWVPTFAGFLDFVPTVPQLYWNVNSMEQRYHLLCRQLHKLVCYADMLGEDLNITHDQVEALEAEFEKFKESGFLDYYETQLEAWINANMERLIKKSMQMVFFGLTLDGHFVAYIPDSWNEIIFDTGHVFGQESYGRLILKYDVDSPYSVEQ